MPATDIVARYKLVFHDAATKGILGVAGAARTMGAGLATATVAAGAAAVGAGKLAYEAANSWFELVDGLTEAGARANVSATYLKDLRFAMGQAGVDAGQLDAGLVKFNVNLGELSTGVGGFGKKLGQIAPALAKNLKGVKDGDKANQIAIGYLGGITDAQERAKVAAILYGKNAGPAMAAAAEDVAALNAAFEESRKISGVIGPSQVQAADEYEKAMTRLKGSMTSLTMVVGGAAAPIIADLANQFSGFVMNNRELIKTGAEKFFKNFGNAVSNIDWEGVGNSFIKLVEYMPQVISLAATVVEHADKIFYAWAAIQALSFGGGLISGLGGLAKAAGLAKTAIAGVGVVGKAGPKLPLIQRMGAGIAQFATLAISKLGAIGTKGFGLIVNAAIRAAPLIGRAVAVMFGPIGIAIGLVVAAGYLIYDNWATIVAYAQVAGAVISGVWASISATGQAAWAALMGAALGAWASIKNAGAAAWQGIKDGAASALNWIIGKINALIATWNAFVPSFAQAPTIPAFSASGSAPGAAVARNRGGGVAQVGGNVVVTLNDYKGARLAKGSVPISSNRPRQPTQIRQSGR